MRSFSSRLRRILLQNTSDSQTIAKNTIWLSISNFGGRLLKATVIIYAARALGPAGWGVVSYAITLAGFFTFFTDPGVNLTFMREGATMNNAQRTQLLSTTFVLKLALLLIVVPFVLVVGPYFTLLPGAALLLPVAAIIIIGDTLREFFSSLVRTQEKMEREAVVFLLTNLLIVIFGFAALLEVRTPGSFGWAYAAGAALGALLAVGIVRPHIESIFSKFSLAAVFTIAKKAWPFAVVGALGLLLTNADILILSWMRSAAEVGIYSAVVRVVQLLYLLPMIIQYSVLPAFSRLARKNDARLRHILERSVAVTYLVSLPLALVGPFVAAPLMQFIFGSSYVAGGASLALLFLTLLVDYPGGILGVALFSYDSQKKLINASLLGGVTNVCLDLLLIPRFGITGSAVATLCAQVLANAYLWHALRSVNSFNIFSKIKKIFVAALCAAAVAALCTFLHMPFLVVAFVAALVYAGMLLVLGEPLIADILSLGANIPTQIAQAEVGGVALQVEVVREKTAIEQGLSGRDALKPGHGMLFVFPEAKQYRFWMAGMRFPIDIIWIHEGRVIDITPNASEAFDPQNPVFYAPNAPAQYVLEVYAGFCAEHGIAPGDRFVYERPL